MKFYLKIIVPLMGVLLWTSDGRAVEVNDYGNQSRNVCYFLKSVNFSSNGFVDLDFGYATDTVPSFYCRDNKYIALASTDPPNQIVSVSGIKGSKIIGNSFTIRVTPNTKSLLVHLYEHDGDKVKVLYFLKKHMDLAKASMSGWKSAWKRSKQRLNEQRSSDRQPPRISVTSPLPESGQQVLRLDSYQIYVRGKVIDNAGVLQLLINGKKARMKANGAFAAKVKLAMGLNKIKIQAEDINGNVSEKLVKVIREEFIPQDTLADVDMPPRTRTKNPDGVAVVIGIENYQYVPAATFAYNDAEVFREYLATTLGYNKAKVKIVTNRKATLAEFNKLLGPNGWLKRNVKPGKSNVVVYFSGHGIPDPKTKLTGNLPTVSQLYLDYWCTNKPFDYF